MSLEMFSKKLQLDTLVDPSFLLSPFLTSLSKLFFGQTMVFGDIYCVVSIRLGPILFKMIRFAANLCLALPNCFENLSNLTKHHGTEITMKD